MTKEIKEFMTNPFNQGENLSRKILCRYKSNQIQILDLNSTLFISWVPYLVKNNVGVEKKYFRLNFITHDNRITSEVEFKEPRKYELRLFWANAFLLL